MKRLLRQRITALFLEGFDDPVAYRALRCLGSLLDSAVGQREAGADLPVAPASLQARLRSGAEEVRSTLERLGEPPGLIRLVDPPTGGERVDLSEWLQEDRGEAARMVTVYLTTLDSAPGPAGSPRDRLEALFVRACHCYNQGLFFEAHEILEVVWRPLPPGRLRTFLQGLIQVSVGFHHAGRGRYAGTVNQLGKGLAKLAEVLPDLGAPDFAAFHDAVCAVRNGVLEGGPARMAFLPGPPAPRLEGGLPAALLAERDLPQGEALDRRRLAC